MARGVSEEFVTVRILEWLMGLGYEILSYDYPHSGTGLRTGNVQGKNLGAIIPDIIAVKDDLCVVFENKNRFYPKDVDKVRLLVRSEYERRQILDILELPLNTRFLGGIGAFLLEKEIDAIAFDGLEIDFFVCVDANGNPTCVYDPQNIFFV